MNVSRRFSLIIRRGGRITRRITLPTCSEALEAAKIDAAWLRGIGTVEIRPVLYVEQEGVDCMDALEDKA